MRHVTRESRVILLAGFVLLTLSYGCGKKAPPKAPGVKPLPPINDLRSTTQGEVLWLSWSIPQKMGGRISKVTGFVIYRSKTATNDAPCENCPVVFKKLSQVPLTGIFPNGIEKEIFSFEDVLEKNHQYVYQVSTLTSEGQESPGSNRVSITY